MSRLLSGLQMRRMMCHDKENKTPSKNEEDKRRTQNKEEG